VTIRGGRRGRVRATAALGITIAAASLTGFAVAATPGLTGKKLIVTPKSGEPTTHFAVQFKLTSPIGTSNGQIRTLSVTVEGPNAAAPAGCIDNQRLNPSITKAGTATVTLTPGSGKARWCPGKFTGTVQETIRPNCQAGQPCPQYIALLPIGSFSFTVR
jgi:hypothetical protein